MNLSTAKVDKIVDQINDLVLTQNTIIYDIGQRLSALKHYRYFEVYGFATWADFCHSETIRMSPSAITRYVRLYERAQDLGYNRDQCTQLADELGTTALEKVFAHIENKLSIRKVRELADEICETAQLNIKFTPAQHRKVIKALKEKGGLVVQDKRNMNLREALFNALEVR